MNINYAKNYRYCYSVYRIIAVNILLKKKIVSWYHATSKALFVIVGMINNVLLLNYCIIFMYLRSYGRGLRKCRLKMSATWSAGPSFRQTFHVCLSLRVWAFNGERSDGLTLVPWKNDKWSVMLLVSALLPPAIWAVPSTPRQPPLRMLVARGGRNMRLQGCIIILFREWWQGTMPSLVSCLNKYWMLVSLVT